MADGRELVTDESGDPGTEPTLMPTRAPSFRVRRKSLSPLVLFLSVACSGGGTPTSASSTVDKSSDRPTAEPSSKPVAIDVFAPGEGDHAGVNGVSWFVDLDLEFPGDVRSTGFTGNQLTGPGVHNNVAPFPGVFAPGKDDRFGGLVVLFSTTTIGAKSCQNTANLFNITGVTNVAEDGTEIWDTWIITAANFGRKTASTLYATEISDRNHDGVYNDAPDVVPDANGDGRCDERDLNALGTDSDIKIVHFFIR